MTATQFYEMLAELEPCNMPVPQLPVKISKSDNMAAKLLLWLDEQTEVQQG